MKKTFTPVYFFLLSLLLISACSSTHNLTIPVQVAPRVILPEHVESIGIVNRTQSAEGGNKVVNVAEGVLTGEGLFEDRNGALACLSGAETQLNIDNLVLANTLDTVNLKSMGTGAMPVPLSWEEVERICKTHGKDALLVLEFFDTDQSNSVTANTVNQVINLSRGGTLSPPVSSGNSRVFLKTGWRLYDYQNRIILDEVRLNDYFGVSSHPYDLGEFGKRDAIQQSAYIAGRCYADRMFPSWVRLRREYYVRKGRQMKAAMRSVQVNEWEAAKEIWEPLTNSHKRKLAGRACYNMAIYYEVIGDLDAAVEWASKSYTRYGDKRARRYTQILKNRRG